MFTWLKKIFVGEEKPASGVRARNSKGRYVADDKSTPNVNEAYVDGKTPKKKAPAKRRGRKPAAKKAPAKRGRPSKAASKK